MTATEIYAVDPTFDRVHIPAVTATTPCTKHGVGLAEPCFRVPSGVDSVATEHWAVCNTRAKKAGMTGKISWKSFKAGR